MLHCDLILCTYSCTMILYTAQVPSIERQQFISPAGEQTSIRRHRELVLRVAEDAVQVRSVLHANQARACSRSLSELVLL